MQPFFVISVDILKILCYILAVKVVKMEKDVKILIKNTCEYARLSTWAIGSAPKDILKKTALKINEKIQEILNCEADAINDNDFVDIIIYANMVRRAAGLKEISLSNFKTEKNFSL